MKPRAKLGGCHKHTPIMGAHRQQAQQIFGPEFRHQEGTRRAVQCGKKHQTPRPRGAGQRAQKGRAFRHVLNHFQANHGIKAARFLGQILGPAQAVINRKPARFGMGAGDLQRFRRRIHPGDVSAKPRQRLRSQPRPAAHIQNPKPGKGLRAMRAAQPFGNPANPHRVHPVQRLHRAIRVPPARGQSVKFGDFRPKRRCFRQDNALSSPDPPRWVARNPPPRYLSRPARRRNRRPFLFRPAQGK